MPEHLRVEEKRGVTMSGSPYRTVLSRNFNHLPAFRILIDEMEYNGTSHVF